MNYEKDITDDVMEDWKEIDETKNNSIKKLKTSTRILNKIKHIFSVHCPSCNGNMWSTLNEDNNIVWTCEQCGEQWV